MDILVGMDSLSMDYWTICPCLCNPWIDSGRLAVPSIRSTASPDRLVRRGGIRIADFRVWKIIMQNDQKKI